MNARAWLLIVPVGCLAVASCSKGPNAQDRASARAELEGPPTSCTHEPWVDGGRLCGDVSIVHHRVTCAELGLNGIQLAPGRPDESGNRSSWHRYGKGLELDTTEGFRRVVDKTFRDWSFATTVRADGSTMTFDALVFTTSESQDSFVARFSEPQFNVRGVSPTIGAIDRIQVCGSRPGRAASLPPPEPGDGPFIVSCSGNGSTSARGTTVHSQAEIEWSVSVSPRPAQGALVAIVAAANGTTDLGTTFTALDHGGLDGGYSSPFFSGSHGSLSLSFAYGGSSCKLYWNVVEDGASSSRGHVW